MAAQTQVEPIGAGVTAGERSQLRERAEAAPPSGGGATSATMALTQRELVSLFFSPIAYVVGFIFLVVAGYIFLTDTLEPGNEASLRTLFEWMAYLLVFAVPILTMRSVAEEFSTGAIEMLMTSATKASEMTAPRTGSFTGSSQFVTHVVATHDHQSATTMMTPSIAPSGSWCSKRYDDSWVSAKT